MKNMQNCQAHAENAWQYVRNRLYYPPTGLIYDHAITDRAEDFPDAADIRRNYPNPCGYGTGMEDGMLQGATMLDACLCRWEKTGASEAAIFAHKLLCGMLRTAEIAADGFIPRAVSPTDGKSYYTDSSRDQYTMLFFALHRYLRSALCTDADRIAIARTAEAVAHRAEKNVRLETGYDMLRADGGPSLVTTMWGGTLGNHEYLRLPMLYLVAWEAGGNGHFLDLYRSLREEAYAKSLPMGNYWHLYTLQQMQASAYVCREADPDRGWAKKYLSLMEEIAAFIRTKTAWVRENLARHTRFNDPQISYRDCPASPNVRYAALGVDCISLYREDAETFFVLQDAADLVIVQAMVQSGRADADSTALFAEAFAKIDFARHERSVPVYFLDGYYRML